MDRGSAGPDQSAPRRQTAELPSHFLFVLANVAPTAWAAFMVTVQEVLVPVQPPLQPLKEKFAAGMAFRVTTVPLG